MNFKELCSLLVPVSTIPKKLRGREGQNMTISSLYTPLGNLCSQKRKRGERKEETFFILEPARDVMYLPRYVGAILAASEAHVNDALMRNHRSLPLLRYIPYSTPCGMEGRGPLFYRNTINKISPSSPSGKLKCMHVLAMLLESK